MDSFADFVIRFVGQVGFILLVAVGLWNFVRLLYKSLED